MGKKLEAKKSFEAGVEIDGEMTYKGSDAHKAAVTGDTVGDPFKDTSGPSMNILIKLTCLVGLVIAPILGGHGDETAYAEATMMEFVSEDGKKTIIKMNGDATAMAEGTEDITVEVTMDKDAEATATATVKVTKDGETTTETFTGTPEEVEAKVEAYKGAEGAKVEIEVKKEVKKVVEGSEESSN